MVESKNEFRGGGLDDRVRVLAGHAAFLSSLSFAVPWRVPSALQTHESPDPVKMLRCRTGCSHAPLGLDMSGSWGKISIWRRYPAIKRVGSCSQGAGRQRTNSSGEELDSTRQSIRPRR